MRFKQKLTFLALGTLLSTVFYLLPNLTVNNATADRHKAAAVGNDMLAKNKEMVRRVWKEAVTQGNLDVVDEIYSADFVSYGHIQVKGTEGVKEIITMYRTGFPDVQITIDDQIAEGEKVVTRWTATGTHKGELMGIAATGKKINVMGITIDRIVNGKIVEEWDSSDDLGMMQQLGVIPAQE